MRSSRLSTCGSPAGAVLFILFLLPNSIVYARIRPVGFPIPSRMLPLREAVTPHEYSELLPAIKSYWAREKTKELQKGPGLGPGFTHITAARVKLGPLGEGFVIYFAHSPECGGAGCPMALLTRGSTGYHIAIMSFGWGYALLPSSGPVPNITFYANSITSQSAGSFRYSGGKFVQAGQAACTAKNNSRPVCAAMQGFSPQIYKFTISPAQYAAMRPAVEASLKKQSPESARRFPFDKAHALNLGGSDLTLTTALALGSSDANHNSRISIYAHQYHGGHYTYGGGRYWPVLSHAKGWGVIPSRFGGPSGNQIALVIARQLSPSEDELTRYIASLTVTGYTLELTPSSRMLPDACEIVTPKSGHWPAQWNAAALVAKPVSCFKTTSPGNTAISAVDTTNILAAVQDGTGTVWAIDGGISPELYRWNNGGWSDMPGAVPGFDPRSLWPGSGGGVLVLSTGQFSSPAHSREAIVWRRGNQTKILANLPSAGQPDLLAHMQIATVASASSGTILIAENGGAVYRNGVLVHKAAESIFRVDSNGQLQRIYAIGPDQYLPSFVPRTGVRIVPFLKLHATRDAQGKVWIWSGWSGPSRPPGASLQGLLVTDGNTVIYHREIPGIPSPHLSCLNVWDSHHLAVGTFGGGLYTINTTTLEVRAVPEPEPGAFRFVQKVFSAGKNHYVLTTGREYGSRIPVFEKPYLTGDLWRLHDGRWKEVLAGIGNTSGVGLATPKGFWLATSGRGLWFVPPQGPPQRVDWRQGVPLASADKLFRLSDGDVLAYSRLFKTHTVEIRPASVLARRPASSRFSILHPLTSIEPDRHHNLWGLLPNRVLGEWNGSQWVRRPLPPRINPSRIVRLDVDTRGRVWLFPNCRMGPMGFFNPVDQLWTVYRDYRFALARRAHPVKFLHPTDDPERPVYGPDSQIVVVGACWGVNYFDGAHWRLFRGRSLPQDRDISIPPFFDSAGDLALEINHATWQWTPSTKWQQTAEVPPQNYVRMLPNSFAPPLPPPEGCPSPSPAASVKDSLGQFWWVAGDALYEGVPGHCRRILSASSRQPFIDGRKLVAAQIGPHGDAFLKTNMPFAYIIVPRKLFGGKVPARARRPSDR